MVIRTRDPHEVIKALSDRTDVLLEGGPTLAGAFLRAGVIAVDHGDAEAGVGEGTGAASAEDGCGG